MPTLLSTHRGWSRNVNKNTQLFILLMYASKNDKQSYGKGWYNQILGTFYITAILIWNAYSKNTQEMYSYITWHHTASWWHYAIDRLVHSALSVVHFSDKRECQGMLMVLYFHSILLVPPGHGRFNCTVSWWCNMPCGMPGLMIIYNFKTI